MTWSSGSALRAFGTENKVVEGVGDDRADKMIKNLSKSKKSKNFHQSSDPSTFWFEKSYLDWN